MRSLRVVVVTPVFEHDLSFTQRVEYFTIQQLIAQLAVEAFAVAVLPRLCNHQSTVECIGVLNLGPDHDKVGIVSMAGSGSGR